MRGTRLPCWRLCFFCPTTIGPPSPNNHDPLFRHPFSSKIFSSSSSSSCQPIHGAAPPTTPGGCRTIIELGSGAVGLSGFVCALALDAYDYHHHHNNNNNHKNQPSNNGGHTTWKVLLTDNDARVLEQLERNLKANHDALLASRRTNNVHIEVMAWDWKDDHPTTPHNNNNNNNNNKLVQPDDQDHDVVLVIGSELVYTKETATACANLMVRLLQQYPDIEIWIVQVADRYGWWDIVVDTPSQRDLCGDNPHCPQNPQNGHEDGSNGRCPRSTCLRSLLYFQQEEETAAADHYPSLLTSFSPLRQQCAT
jgi:hypothetical protein